MLGLVTPVPAETVSLIAACGRWAASDILAKRTQPARDLSAMDGYAVRSADGIADRRVIGESAAGRPWQGQLEIGEAIRIFTGAAIPAGGDCVIIQENVARTGDTISINPSVKMTRTSHVRCAGSDFLTGNLIIPRGTRLSPRHIALAATAGWGHLPVNRPIRVAILSTGDELVPPGGDAGNDHLPASNGVMIATMLAGMGAVCDDLGIVVDKLDILTHALTSIRDADIIVTTGGASVGDHDLVRPALIAAGAEINFWKVMMRPGKPVMAGRLGSSIVLGLPGNPVSAYVTATLFLLPLVAALGGASSPIPKPLTAQLGASLPATGDRLDHVRARLENGHLYPIGSNDSSALRALADADALIVRPPGAPAANPGDFVDYLNLA
jgi:molybdopterin molybdotransferase